MADVGLSVREGIASGVTPFVESSKHNVGLLMERERGVIGRISRITSLQEDRKIFGGIVSGKHGAYATRHIFNNVGNFGAQIFGSRILGTSLAATADLEDKGDYQTITITETEGSDPVVQTVEVTNVEIGDEFDVTIAGVTLSFTAIVATAASVYTGLAAAIALEVTTTDPGGTVDIEVDTYVAGAESLVITMHASKDPVVSVASTNESSTTIFTVNAGSLGEEDPGTWANSVLTMTFYPQDHALGLPGAYYAEVSYNGEIVETFSATTWTLFVTEVNTKSYYVMIDVTGGSLGSSIEIPQTLVLTGGTYVAPVEADFYPGGTTQAPTGLSLFDGQDVQLISTTEFFTDTMAVQGRDYAANRGDCVYIHNHVEDASDSAVEATAAALQQDNPSFIAGYNFWVKTSDESGTYVWEPGLGIVIGAGYIRVPKMQRDHVWIPPAGLESAFRDCIDIKPRISAQSTINLYVQRYTTNVAVFRPGKGFFLMSSRTYSTNPLFMSVHIRRFTNYIVGNLNTNMLFAAQKLNSPELRRQIIVAITAEFRGYYRDGGLERTVPFADAFECIADSSNNPGTQDRKLLNVDVNYIPAEATEMVRIRVNRNDGKLIIKALEEA